MMDRYSAGMFILISSTDETKYIPCNSIIMYTNSGSYLTGNVWINVTRYFEKTESNNMLMNIPYLI
jgi:hypothetical protein